MENGKSDQGFVALVGAGPGDPGLITVAGARLLEQAHVVVYDYLSNPRLLSYCPQAEIIYVGKKAASHSMSQEQINAILVEKARAGKRVVRLKGEIRSSSGAAEKNAKRWRRRESPTKLCRGLPPQSRRRRMRAFRSRIEI